ncbi:uncharacterized protein METZ01_LOCUS354269, partial [marine metagenome]
MTILGERSHYYIITEGLSKLISVSSQNVNGIKINQLISDKKKVWISFDSDS